MGRTSKELRELYKKTPHQNRLFFITKLLHFRKVIISTSYTIEQKYREFENLIIIVLKCDLTELDTEQFLNTCEEFSIINEEDLRSIK